MSWTAQEGYLAHCGDLDGEEVQQEGDVCTPNWLTLLHTGNEDCTVERKCPSENCFLKNRGHGFEANMVKPFFRLREGYAKETAAHSSILAGKIPWTEEPRR